MLCSNVHKHNVKVPCLTVGFTAQERHPRLPRAHLPVQDTAGGNTFGLPQQHPKLLPQQQPFTKLTAQKRFRCRPPNPALSQVTNIRALETEGCQIISVLQYKQAASQATQLKTQFPTDSRLSFSDLAPSACGYKGEPGSPVPAPAHSAATLERQPALPRHNTHSTVWLPENVRGCLLLSSSSYKIAATIIFDISSSFQDWMKWAWKSPAKKEQPQELLFPTTVQCFWQL